MYECRKQCLPVPWPPTPVAPAQLHLEITISITGRVILSNGAAPANPSKSTRQQKPIDPRHTNLA
jgi:hypothetical protein